MELSEEAVRQRLTRGRKLLHEQVLAFVEGALEKTNPGKAFTFGVLTALPVAATTAKAATVGTALAKGGATAKSALTVGTLGGLFAVLGGSYIGWKAHADEAKSLREHQFMRQMIGFRMVITLLIFAGFIILKKIDFSHEPLLKQSLQAGFLFVITVIGQLFYGFACHRQRQIQIEDGTWNEVEWRVPRRETEPKLNQAGGQTKWQARLKAAKFLAFAIVMYAIMAVSSPWAKHPGQATVFTAALIMMLLLAVRGWLNRPRYLIPHTGWTVALPAMMGLLTLWIFNAGRYAANSKLTAANGVTPDVVLLFNGTVILAYALFTGFLYWKGRSESRSATRTE